MPICRVGVLSRLWKMALRSFALWRTGRHVCRQLRRLSLVPAPFQVRRSNMKKSAILFASTAAIVLAFAVPAQSASFFNSLLGGSNWQPPKCTAPQVLRETKDKNGRIVWRCVKPEPR
jgi:hypothetical protein